MYSLWLGICLGGERPRRRSYWSALSAFISTLSDVDTLLLFFPAWHRAMDRRHTLGAFSRQVLEIPGDLLPRTLTMPFLGMNFYSIARESSTWNWTPSVSRELSLQLTNYMRHQALAFVVSAYIFLLAHTMDALENVSSNKRTLYM